MVIFTAKNHHVPSCGLPDETVDAEDAYTSYFENTHGEQWIFVYDYKNKKGYVTGGDISWEKVHFSDSKSVDKMFMRRIFNQEERLWTIACLTACGIQVNNESYLPVMIKPRIA